MTTRDSLCLCVSVVKNRRKFFRYGFDSESLHDARLLSLRVGDDVGFIANGEKAFRINRWCFGSNGCSVAMTLVRSLVEK